MDHVTDPGVPVRPATSAGVAVFEELASGYDAWFDSPLGGFVLGRQLEGLRRALAPLAPRSRVAEIGAGTGQVTAWLGARGFEVVAVEPAACMLRLGVRRTRRLRVHWVRGRAERLPLASRSLDAAVFFTALEFVDDVCASLAEARRVVRPGGLVVAAFLDARSPWGALYRSQADTGAAPWTSARLLTPANLQACMPGDPQAIHSAVFLAPAATPPYVVADWAGRRAGNQGALSIVCWRLE